MKLLQTWKPEIVEIINSKNSLSLKESDVDLTLVSNTDGAITVRVSPAVGSPYFNEQTLTYVARDMAKAFLGLPLRIIVNDDTTIRSLVETIANRYGVPFDTAVDFAQSELDKAVDFSASGIQDIEIPVADTSFVWIGKLKLTVANDGLDLETLIQNVDLTNLAYLSGDSTKASLSLASVANDWSKIYDAQNLGALEVGNQLTSAQANAILGVMVVQSGFPQADVADVSDALVAGSVKAKSDNNGVTVLQIGPVSTPTWAGDVYIGHVDGGSSTKLSLNSVFPADWTVDIQAFVQKARFMNQGDVIGQGLITNGESPSLMLMSFVQAWLAEDGHAAAMTDEEYTTLSTVMTTMVKAGNLLTDRTSIAGTVGFTVSMKGAGDLTGQFNVHVTSAQARPAGAYNSQLNYAQTELTLETFADGDFQRMVLRQLCATDPYAPLSVDALFSWNPDTYSMSPRNLEIHPDFIVSNSWIVVNPDVPNFSMNVNLYDVDVPKLDLATLVSEGQTAETDIRPTGIVQFSFQDLIALPSGPSLAWVLPVLSQTSRMWFGLKPESSAIAGVEADALTDMGLDLMTLAATPTAADVLGLDAEKLALIPALTNNIQSMYRNGGGNVYVYSHELSGALVQHVRPFSYYDQFMNSLKIQVLDVPRIMEGMSISVTTTEKAALDALVAGTPTPTQVLAVFGGKITIDNMSQVAALMATMFNGYNGDGTVNLHPIELRVGETEKYHCPASQVDIGIEVHDVA